MKPLISVITPTFNRSDFITEAIESVIKQTYSNFEMIIIDDGSTDNTREVVSRYLVDSRVRYYYQSNRGQSVARNKGLSKADGAYVCFLDSDNIWFHDKLEKTLATFNALPRNGVVYGDVVTINDMGEEISRNNMRRFSGKITRYLLRDNCVSMNTAMARKECFETLGGMDESCRVADDYELWLRLSTEYEFFYLPEYLASYRVMPDQISSDKTKRFASNQKIIENFIVRFPNAVCENVVSEGWCYFFSRQGRYYADNGEFRKSFLCYIKAMRHQGSNILPWRGMLRLLIGVRGS